MKKSLIALSFLAINSFALNTWVSGDQTFFDCRPDDSMSWNFYLNNQAGNYYCRFSTNIYGSPVSECMASLSSCYSKGSSSSCDGANACTSNGQCGQVIKDGNTGFHGCYAKPRYSDYNPSDFTASCSAGTINVSGKCHSTTCPQGMTCGTNPNGTLKMTGAEDKIYTRKHANGDIDAIMKDGSYTTYDKNGNPVRHVDANGNIVKDAVSAGTQSVVTTDPRGTAFNPIIAGALVGNGYLITSAGLIASGIGLTSGVAATVMTGGLALIGAGGVVAAYSYLKDISGNPAPASSAGQQGITLDISNFDTSGGGSALAPTSTTQNANGSTTKVYKPNANTTVTETEYYDGVVEYVTQDKTTNTTTAFSVNKADLADKGSTTLQPQDIPVTQYTPNTDGTITTPNATYIPDIATGGVIPANPQSSGGGSTSGGGDTSSGGGISDPAGGSTSGGSSSSGGGTMGSGQTSGAAGTDGNSTTDGQGKDFGSEFGDFATFKSWDEVLGALGGFKNTITESFNNLQNSISSLKGTFQDGDGNSKINASLGSGSADSCNFSFSFRGNTIDLKDGIGKGADVFRPFITLIISIVMSVFSVVAVYKVIRGGAE